MVRVCDSKNKYKYRRHKPSPRFFTFDVWHWQCGLFRRQQSDCIIIGVAFGLGVALVVFFLQSLYIITTEGHLALSTTSTTNDVVPIPQSHLVRASPLDEKKLLVQPDPFISNNKSHTKEGIQHYSGVNSDQNDHTNKPVVIAHVVSLIKCGTQASVTGFLDAAAVLRHSIHKTSIHFQEHHAPTNHHVSRYS
jgi:hypothetical protein